jgi:RNA recognition motif-containing protein
LSTLEAAKTAVELLHKKELDSRQVIVEIAKPADQKDKEKKEKRAKRRPGRRGSKAVPGEISEAEANGDTDKIEAPAAAPDTEAARPKKKKKKATVCPSSFSLVLYIHPSFFLVSVSPRLHQQKARLQKLRLSPL